MSVTHHIVTGDGILEWEDMISNPDLIWGSLVRACQGNRWMVRPAVVGVVGLHYPETAIRKMSARKLRAMFAKIVESKGPENFGWYISIMEEGAKYYLTKEDLANEQGET